MSNATAHGGADALPPATTSAQSGPVRIDADIPGGNILVERLETRGDEVRARLRPDLRDTEGNWFYWHFRLGGAAGKRLRVELTQRDTLADRGPAVSLDGGWTWSWLDARGGDAPRDGGDGGNGGRDGGGGGGESYWEWGFAYDVPAGADDVRFSMGMPYTLRNLERFLAERQEHPALVRDTLCRTAKGRMVPRLRLGRLDGDAPLRMLFTARHHCCEMMASYVLEGLIDAILAEDGTGDWFRRTVEVGVVPMVDLDGVEEGDQGKNRRPRDHNRDYIGAPVHPETAAIREWIPAWSAGRLRIVLDLHCPYIRYGTHNTRIYMPGSPMPEVWRQQQRFGHHLQSASTTHAPHAHALAHAPAPASGRASAPPLPYDPAHNLPFGEGWNTNDNYDAGMACSRWGPTLPGVVLSSTLEFPYAVVGALPVGAANARAFGRVLAEGLRAYGLEVLS